MQARLAQAIAHAADVEREDQATRDETDEHARKGRDHDDAKHQPAIAQRKGVAA